MSKAILQAMEIAQTMERANKACKDLFGKEWPAQVKKWEKIFREKQAETGETDAETVVTICTLLEPRPWLMTGFLAAAYDIMQPNKTQ